MHTSAGKFASPKTVGVPLPHPPMRSLETSGGSQHPPFTLSTGVPAEAPRSCARPLAIPLPSPFALRGSGAHLQRIRSRSAETRRTRDRGRPRRSYSLVRSLHSFNSAEVQFPPGAEEPGSAGALRERGAESHTQPAGPQEREAASGAGERDAEPCGAAGRTSPGRQCAFVYVARAAAANRHLKSARVSPRQRPAVQSPSRRAPRTPGPRSLWYISDLTSRLGLILRWERFTLVAHLGGFFFFRKKCDFCNPGP